MYFASQTCGVSHGENIVKRHSIVQEYNASLLAVGTILQIGF